MKVFCSESKMRAEYQRRHLKTKLEFRKIELTKNNDEKITISAIKQSSFYDFFVKCYNRVKDAGLLIEHPGNNYIVQYSINKSDVLIFIVCRLQKQNMGWSRWRQRWPIH